jgi:hypothetical protein
VQVRHTIANVGAVPHRTLPTTPTSSSAARPMPSLPLHQLTRKCQNACMHPRCTPRHWQWGCFPRSQSCRAGLALQPPTGYKHSDTVVKSIDRNYTRYKSISTSGHVGRLYIPLPTVQLAHGPKRWTSAIVGAACYELHNQLLLGSGVGWAPARLAGRK